MLDMFLLPPKGGGGVSRPVTAPAAVGEDIIVTGPATMLGLAYQIGTGAWVLVMGPVLPFTIPGSADQEVHISLVMAPVNVAPPPVEDYEIPVITSWSIEGTTLTVTMDAPGTISTLVDDDGTASEAEIIAAGNNVVVTTGSATITIDVGELADGTWFANLVPWDHPGHPGAAVRIAFEVASSGPVVLYEEHFDGSTWQTQVGGVDLFQTANTTPALQNAATATVSTGSPGRIHVDAIHIDSTEQWATIAMLHPDQLHDFDFKGEWINQGAGTAAGCFRARWVNDANAVVAEIVRIPAGTATFASANHNLDTAFSAVIPPAGATKLQFGWFATAGPNNPRWARGNAFINDIVFRETGAA